MPTLPKTALPKTLDATTASGRTIFFRADLNLPMQDGKISDTTRMTRLAPAISALAESGARVVVASHLGRPKGTHDPNLSLKPVAEALAECLARPVEFVADIAGEPAQNAVRALQDGGILMLENLRFDAGEESNDADFAARLMEGIDIYVNDAFACSHRHHASICAAAGMRPAFAGALMLEELQALNQALTQPKRPLVAVVRRRKNIQQIDHAKSSSRAGRCADFRGRDGEHVFIGSRRGSRRIISRSRFTSRGPSSKSHSKEKQLPANPTKRTRSSNQIRTQRPPPNGTF